MSTSLRIWPAIVLVSLAATAVLGQQSGKEASTADPAAPLPSHIAATVNGQPITVRAVQRGLQRIPDEKKAETRVQIVKYLVENLLIDQYLRQVGTDVSEKEIADRFAQVQADIKKGGQPYDKVLAELMVTEEELKAQLTEELRWDKFLEQKATDKALQAVFEKNPEMFDGTTVRARHILLIPDKKNPDSAAQVQAALKELKKQIEQEAARQLSSLPADTKPAVREELRAKRVEEAFADAARKHSACPSKTQGGDVGWFPRIGSMIEPFARTAFELKPFEISDILVTENGCHLVLATGRKPGQKTNFEDVKDVVKEVYSDRLREYLCNALRPRAKIVVATATKP